MVRLYVPGFVRTLGVIVAVALGMHFSPKMTEEEFFMTIIACGLLFMLWSFFPGPRGG